MKFINIYYFTVFLYLISSGTSYSIEQPDIKNLIIHEEKKIIKEVYFFDSLNNKKTLEEYRNNISLINFWATWCAPCKEEMPSLDLLQKNEYLKNLKILPINVGQENMEKASNFFKDLEIKNLDFYYDSSITLAKKFGLRGIPTTILFNKDGFEFARIVGSINFQNKEFIEWLSNYN